MESAHGPGVPSQQLIGVVRGVRNRYRAKRALRGAAITIAASWAILALSAYAMNALHYGDAAVITIRIVSLLAIAAVAIVSIVLPLRPKFDDQRVAMYLEEHEHSLKASVLTAVEMQSSGTAPSPALRSPALIERLTRAAVERVHSVNDGRTIDAGELRTNGGILAAVVAAALVLTIFGPPVIRNGVRLVVAPWNRADATNPFGITVSPGNTTVAKGGDLMIDARLRGFTSDTVELLVLVWARSRRHRPTSRVPNRHPRRRRASFRRR